MTTRPRASLTARLALLFGLVAAATLTSAGTYLYHSLAIQLETRDDAELLGKIELVRHLLQEVNSPRKIQEDPHRFLDAIAGARIPAEQQARIFDRFYRGDTARQDSSSSSGLGLAIVKSIMQLHQGSVTVESAPGGGVEFRLIFPLRASFAGRSTG